MCHGALTPRTRFGSAGEFAGCLVGEDLFAPCGFQSVLLCFGALVPFGYAGDADSHAWKCNANRGVRDIGSYTGSVTVITCRFVRLIFAYRERSFPYARGGRPIPLGFLRPRTVTRSGAPDLSRVACRRRLSGTPRRWPPYGRGIVVESSGCVGASGAVGLLRLGGFGETGDGDDAVRAAGSVKDEARDGDVQ